MSVAIYSLRVSIDPEKDLLLHILETGRKWLDLFESRFLSSVVCFKMFREKKFSDSNNRSIHKERNDIFMEIDI